MISKYMTRYGIEAIRKRIARLEEQYHESLGHAGAAAQDDPNSYHDNFEYEEGMRRADLLARQASMLRATLQSALVADPPAQTEQVGIGHVATIEIDGSGTCQLLICGEGEGALIEDGCSIASPLGQTLLGMRVGETRLANLPRDARNVRLISIRIAETGDFRPSDGIE
jgi:transcription elongation factor GreA